MVLRSAASALLLIALTACGGGEGDRTASTEQYVDTLAAAYRLGDGEFGGLPADPARCLATTVVESLGTDALNQAGVTPFDLADAPDVASLPVAAPEDLAGRLHEAIGTCGVVPGLEAALIEGISTGAAGSAVSPENAACVAAAVDDASLSLGFAAAMVDEANLQAAAQPVLDGFGACPGAAVELLVDMFEAEGTPLTPEGRACIEATVLADPAGAATMWANGGAEAEAFGVRLGQACPNSFA